jgi:hypothetical protein
VLLSPIRLLALSALALLLSASSTAAASADQWTAGPAAMRTAKSIATATWGQAPCGGHVSVAWAPEPESVNGVASWNTPVPATGNPQDNTGCRIVFSSTERFTWPKFCTVVAHEYGHLLGRPHSADGPDLMSPVYRKPLPACAATPAPASSADRRR